MLSDAKLMTSVVSGGKKDRTREASFKVAFILPKHRCKSHQCQETTKSRCHVNEKQYDHRESRMSYWQNSLSNNTDVCCEISMANIVEEQLHSYASAGRYFTLDLRNATDGERMNQLLLAQVQYRNEGDVLDMFYSVYPGYRKREVSVGLQFFFVIYEPDQKMCNGISPIGFQQPICNKDGLCFAKKMICTLMPIIRYFICQENLVVNNSALIHIKQQKCTNGDID